MPPLRSLPLALAAALAALASAASPARAADADAAVAEVRIAFTGSSTLHDFDGTAAPLTVPLAPAAGGTWAADVAVPVASLDTGSARRDAKMREMLRGDAHPLIRGTFRDVEPERVRRSRRLPFVLEIGGARRPTTAVVRAWREGEAGETLSFDADLDVSLAAFDLEAPRALLFMRVADVVHVTVHVVVRRVSGERERS